jgi:DNA-binding response OmpR family regulator
MPKILVVDDDPDIVEAVTAFLTTEGFDVASAHNRTDGLAAVKAENPDLIVLDVMMEEPDDGFAMAQQLRADKFDKPILMLTSVGKAIGMEFGKKDSIVPVDEFVEKPVAPSTLIEKVKALLAK